MDYISLSSRITPFRKRLMLNLFKKVFSVFIHVRRHAPFHFHTTCVEHLRKKVSRLENGFLEHLFSWKNSRKHAEHLRKKAGDGVWLAVTKQGVPNRSSIEKKA